MLSGEEEMGVRPHKKRRQMEMIREIRFIVTGEVRKPKSGDWFLNRNNFPICAAQDFNVTKFPMLRMEVVDEEGKAVYTHCANM